MKKSLKNLIKLSFKFIINILSRVNFGRYILDQLVECFLERKKTINYKNLKLHFYVPNRLIDYRINTFSTKEPETLEWIDKFEAGSNFWDIGANIGLYSCYAAKRKQCKVYSFEPSIFNLEWLGKNIQLNDLTKKIAVIPIPLNDVIAENTLNFSSTQWSGALTTFGENYTHDGSNIKKIFKLSTIGISMDNASSLLKIPQPNYIKIDVDGIEHLILKGGAKILSNTRELLIEIDEKFEKQKTDCFKYLKDSGFSLKEKKQSNMFKNTDFSSSYNQIWVKKL